MNIINKAILFALEAHASQRRKYTNHPYIVHPLEVLLRMTQYSNDENVLSAAILHDVIEDCKVTEEELNSKFNSTIGKYVKELTNPSNEFKHLKRKVRKELDNKHYSNVSAEAKLIKLVDRTANLNDFSKCLEEKNIHLDVSFCQLYLKESKELYKFLKNTNKDAEFEYLSACDELECNINAICN